MMDCSPTRYAHAVRDVFIAGGFLFLFLLCGAAPVHAQDGVPHREVVDSLHTISADSMAVADTLKQVIALDTVLPLHTHGRVLLTVEPPATVVTKHDIRLWDYNGLYELIERSTHTYPLSLGQAGGMNHVSFYGADPRAVAVGYNGRSLADPALGFYNLEQFPVEALERISVMTGTYAAILADNASGAYVNLEEIRYNTSRPYTRIWYHQGGYKHIASDGVFSQNVDKRLNVTLGFRRQSARGRYENSFFDAWNLRGVVRWNASDYTNISLSEIFTSHFTETNGGVDWNASAEPGNELTADVEYPALEERVYRHDLTLTASSYLAQDSSTSVSGSAYYSHALWEKDRTRALWLSPADTSNLVSFVTRRVGITGQFEQHFYALLLVAGGKIEQLVNDRTVYFADNRDIESSAFGLITLFPHSAVKLSAGVRARFAEEKVHMSAGLRAETDVNEHTRLWADFSRSVRTPSVVEGTDLQSEDHVLALVGLGWKVGKHSTDLTVFYRSTQHAVVAAPALATTGTVINTVFANAVGAVNTMGAILSYEGRISSFVASAFLDATYRTAAGERVQTFPLLYGGLTVMYEYAVGRSALRAGVRVRGLTSFAGNRYVPLTWSYIPVQEESGAKGNGLDLLASATLGNAAIRLSFNNVLGQTYYYVPFYPQEEGAFRLSVSWAFLD